MATKTKSLGTLLQANISGTWTTVGLRLKIDGPDQSNEMVDTSHLDSDSVERDPTIPDMGTVSGTLWFDPNDTVHMQIETWRYDPPATAPQWKMVLPSSPSKSITFSAWVSKFKITGIDPKGYLQAEFELSGTGLPVWA